jgi:hypothetical protein
MGTEMKKMVEEGRPGKDAERAKMQKQFEEVLRELIEEALDPTHP